MKGVQEPYRYEWRCKTSGRGSVGDLLLEFCQQLGLLSEDCNLSHNGDRLDQACLLQEVQRKMMLLVLALRQCLQQLTAFQMNRAC